MLCLLSKHSDTDHDKVLCHRHALLKRPPPIALCALILFFILFFIFFPKKLISILNIQNVSTGCQCKNSKESCSYHDDELAALRAVGNATGSHSFFEFLVGMLTLAPTVEE